MEFIFGAVIGLANIIPGVSGGTFALVLGIYDRLLQTVAAWNVAYLQELFADLKQGKFRLLLKKVLDEENLFLGKIMVGAGVTILLVSKLMKYLLAEHYAPTYGFFFGLILFSIYLPYKMTEKRKFSHFFWLLLGLALTVFISASVDPSVKILQKSANFQQILLSGVDFRSAYGLGEYVSLFFVGALAISAMVLPGISGSFILLLFGRYSQIIGAISRLNQFYMEDIALLAVFGLGIVFGMVVFVRLLTFLFARFKDQTLFFLLGLMLGSLYALWPFKGVKVVDIFAKVEGKVVLLADQTLVTNKLALPSDVRQLLPVAIAGVVGMLVMVWFIRYEAKQGK